MKATVNLLAVALALVLGFHLAGTSSEAARASLDPDENLVRTAESTGSFGTLVAAVRAAGLTEALSGEGPFTLFAPTDQAFARLPEGTVETLLRPENRDRLRDLLLQHVIAGRLSAEAVTGIEEVTTLAGGRLAVNVDEDGGVMVGGAEVVQVDLQASNGIIHAIDSVILPE
ncbi:MAG: fasciclin domain-containing protein [Gemmatimonadota bacterium]|nr:fasciclin domain-containing protein [Gemmatimonadota bacterium]